MNLEPLPFRSSLEQYEKQAGALLEAYRSRDSQAIRVIHEKHPRFLDPKIPWLPRNLPDSEILSAGLELPDAQITIARWYDFLDWRALTEYVEMVTEENVYFSRNEIVHRSANIDRPT